MEIQKNNPNIQDIPRKSNHCFHTGNQMLYGDIVNPLKLLLERILDSCKLTCMVLQEVWPFYGAPYWYTYPKFSPFPTLPFPFLIFSPQISRDSSPMYMAHPSPHLRPTSCHPFQTSRNFTCKKFSRSWGVTLI